MTDTSPLNSISVILENLKNKSTDFQLPINTADEDINAVNEGLNKILIELGDSYIYKSFVKVTEDVVFKLDISGNFLYVSDSVSNTLGFSPNELLNTNTYSYIHQKDLEKLKEKNIDVLFDGDDIQTTEFRFRKKDDSYIWVESRAIKLKTTGNVQILQFLRNISKRKEAELLLTESTQKFKKLFEVSPIGMAIVSLNGKWVDVNESLVKTFRYSKEELLQKTFQELTYPDDLNKDLELAMRLLNMEIPSYTLEKRYIAKDGTIIWGLLSGVLIKSEENEPLYFLSQVEDITEIKLKIHELQKREEELLRFKNAVDHSFNHIIITDVDGTILFANKAAEKMTGYSFEEMKHNTPRLWGQQMPKEYYLKMWKTIKQDKLPFHGEVTNKRKSGQTYIALASISPILNDYNEVIGFLGIEEDITQIRELDKMKSDFLSIAAHQLRSPLGSIRWNLDTLHEGVYGELNEKQKNAIKICLDTNVHLLGLINDLLDVTKIDEGRVAESPSDVNVKEIINDVIEKNKGLMDDKKITLELSIAQSPLYLFLDASHFYEVIQNIISNAIKYNKENGKIIININDKDNNIEFKFLDTGIGIPQNSISHIFDRFHRADNALKSNIEGSGLGLYVVKKYVEMWRGTVTIESEINEGTTLTVTIPKKAIQD